MLYALDCFRGIFPAGLTMFQRRLGFKRLRAAWFWVTLSLVRCQRSSPTELGRQDHDSAENSGRHCAWFPETWSMKNN